MDYRFNGGPTDDEELAAAFMPPVHVKNVYRPLNEMEHYGPKYMSVTLSDFEKLDRDNQRDARYVFLQSLPMQIGAREGKHNGVVERLHCRTVTLSEPHVPPWVYYTMRSLPSQRDSLPQEQNQGVLIRIHRLCMKKSWQTRKRGIDCYARDLLWVQSELFLVYILES